MSGAAEHAGRVRKLFGANTAAHHHDLCDWHFEQYPQECTCGATRARAPWFEDYVRRRNAWVALGVPMLPMALRKAETR